MSKWTKEYTSAYMKSYYIANRDKYKAYGKKKYAKEKEQLKQQYELNKKQILEQKRKLRLENPEKYQARDKAYYEKHRAKRIEKSLRWARNNPAKKNAQVRKREHAKSKRAPPWLTPDQLAQIGLFYDAATRLTKEIGIAFAVDHIVPLQGKNVSGLHVPWNLQVITAAENSSKGNRY